MGEAEEVNIVVVEAGSTRDPLFCYLLSQSDNSEITLALVNVFTTHIDIQ